MQKQKDRLRKQLRKGTSAFAERAALFRENNTVEKAQEAAAAQSVHNSQLSTDLHEVDQPALPAACLFAFAQETCNACWDVVCNVSGWPDGH